MDGVRTQAQHPAGVNAPRPARHDPLTNALVQPVVLVASPHTDDRLGGVIVDARGEAFGEGGAGDEHLWGALQDAVVVGINRDRETVGERTRPRYRSLHRFLDHTGRIVVGERFEALRYEAVNVEHGHRK